MGTRTRVGVLLVGVMGAVLAGCAGGGGDGGAPSRAYATLEPRYSGYLRDYTRLRPSPRHEGTMYEQSRDLVNYREFIVEPMRVLPRETVSGVLIDGATATRLGAALRSHVVETLGINYKVVHEPGPGVAVIRAAITELARSKVLPDGSIVIGGAAVEAEIIDSVTGKRLGAVVEADAAEGVFDKRTHDPYQDAEMVFGHWAARLNLWLESADELATE